LANRPKLHMDKIDSLNQSTFIKGRSIHDNSILAHEIFHTIKHKQGNGGLMAIKLDMEKAFDRMEWGFIPQNFLALGFSPDWVHLIDLMVFARAKANEASSILNCLKKFSEWSGQKVNLSNSSIFLSKNCTPSMVSPIQSILNLRQIPPKAKQLGLPLFFHRSKKIAFIDLKQKILSKISSWKAKLLSQAARTTLIKTMANAIPSYTMSLFLLLKNLCNDLESNLRKF
jgi:hypothetical protein